MSGYPYGGNPQYPSPQNPIYPQLYNPTNNATPGQPSAPGYPAPGHAPQPGYAQQPGFAYQYSQPMPGQPNPAAMAYPGIAPTPVYPSAPSMNGYPAGTPNYNVSPIHYSGIAAGVNVTPTSSVQWIPSSVHNVTSLSDRAVVAGYEGHDGSPLWVIRSSLEGDLIPGKVAVKHHGAYVAWNGKEHSVSRFEVCCARPETVRWVESRDGVIPPNAVVGGKTSSGEPLYVGRAKHQGSLTPGKVHPSHKVLYISFGGEEIPHKTYEVLCNV